MKRKKRFTLTSTFVINDCFLSCLLCLFPVYERSSGKIEKDPRQVLDTKPRAISVTGNIINL